MSRFTKRGIGLVAATIAMEEEDLRRAAELEGSVQEEIEDNAHSVETNILDADQMCGQIQTAETAIDEAEDTVATLESIRDTLASSLVPNSQGMKVVNLSTSLLLGKLGVEQKQQLSLESLNEDRQLGLEDFKESIKKAWEHIVAMVKKAIEWMVDFFQRLFSSAEALKARAEKFKKIASGDRVEPAEKTVRSEMLANRLHVGGVVGKNIRSDLATFSEEVKKAYTSAVSNGEKMGHLFNKLYPTGKPDMKQIFLIFDNFTIPKGDFSLGQEINKGEDIDDPELRGKISKLRSKEMFGGMAIIAHVPNQEISGMTAAHSLEHINATVDSFEEEAKGPKSDDLPILSSDIDDVLNTVITVADDMIRYREESKKLGKIKNDFLLASWNWTMAAIDLESGNIKSVSGDNSQLRKAINANRIITTFGNRFIGQPAVEVSQYAYRVCNSLLNWTELSLKQMVQTSSVSEGTPGKHLALAQ